MASTMGIFRINKMRNWLAVIILTPIVLLGLVFWMVVGAIFKNSIWPSLDFGSAPDWFSALSSVFTAFIAWKAFRAAPNWFKQKLDESAISLALDLVENYAPKIDSEIKKIITINADSKRKVASFVDNSTYYSNYDLDSKIKEVIELIENMQPLFDYVVICEGALKKRGWVINPYFSYEGSGTKAIYEHAKSYTTIDFTKYPIILEGLKLFKNTNPDQFERYQKDLDELHKKIEDVTIRIYIYSQKLTSLNHIEKLFS